MRVLIVDDGPAGDDLAHHLRMRYGAETFRSKTLSDGLAQRIEIKNLHFVVLDLSFPDSPSREETIKCIPAIGKGVPVFVYTGYEDKALLQKSLDEGAADWFLKGDTNKGGTALAARLAAFYYRAHKPNGGGDRIIEQLFETRKRQAKGSPGEKQSWFSTTNAVVTMAVLLILQLIALCGFMYSQGGANALFRKQVADNTQEISVLRGLPNDLKSVETRVNSQEQRLNAMDGKLDSIRGEMNAGFNKIYELLLAQKERESKH